MKPLVLGAVDIIRGGIGMTKPSGHLNVVECKESYNTLMTPHFALRNGRIETVAYFFYDEILIKREEAKANVALFSRAAKMLKTMRRIEKRIEKARQASDYREAIDDIERMVDRCLDGLGEVKV